MPSPDVGPDLALILALVIPLLAVQVALVVIALRDLTRPDRRVRGGNKWLWAAVILLGEVLGPILYFLVGREDA